MQTAHANNGVPFARGRHEPAAQQTKTKIMNEQTITAIQTRNQTFEYTNDCGQHSNTSSESNKITQESDGFVGQRGRITADQPT